MKIIIYLFALIFLISCNKPKTVFLCGDHVCVNKAEAEHGANPGSKLPGFKVEMWSDEATITLDVEAVDRAHWAFEQPTIGGLVSNFTYNEYPLYVKKLVIRDKNGVRTEKNYDWIRGNAEHSWGILH